MSVPLMPSSNKRGNQRRGAKLPHWTKRDAIYAVTFRLADATPRERVSIPAELAGPDVDPIASVAAIDAILEEARGECHLRDSSIAQMVSEAIQRFADQRYRLLAWSVMPNHVHLVLRPINGYRLDQILHSIKSFTAHRANETLGRTGDFWDHESFDHLVRDAKDLVSQCRYAADNPERSHFEDWPWAGINESGIDEELFGAAGEMHERDAHATGDGDRSLREIPQPLPPAFSYIARRLGVIDSVRTLQLGSPFDYPNQATLYVESSLPDPADHRKFTPAAISKIEHYVRHTHGGAFVLFTSFAMLRECADKLRSTFEHLGLPVLVQGVDGTPRQLLQRFRDLDDAVLFGTTSFWQGIDVQGSKLRNVIIAKLPFAVPDEPLIEAKLEDVTRRGGNAFMDLSLPEAIIRFKQGFGRLIRSKTDKGIVVVLDPRVKTKRYGRAFLDALPDVRIVEVHD